eukprot:09763.XXX_512549_511595_1 [CDS] Oithona nana genome sequencing.
MKNPRCLFFAVIKSGIPGHSMVITELPIRIKKRKRSENERIVQNKCTKKELRRKSFYETECLNILLFASLVMTMMLG